MELFTPSNVLDASSIIHNVLNTSSIVPNALALDPPTIITDSLLRPSSISTSSSPNLITPETNPSSLTSSSASLSSTAVSFKSDLSNVARIWWIADKTTLPDLSIRLRAHNVAKRKIREIIRWHDFHGCAYNEEDCEYVKWIRDYVEVETCGYKFINKLGIASWEHKRYGPHSVMVAIAAFLEPRRFGGYNWYCNYRHSSEVQAFAEWLIDLIKIYHDEQKKWLEATKDEEVIEGLKSHQLQTRDAYSPIALNIWYQ